MLTRYSNCTNKARDFLLIIFIFSLFLTFSVYGARGGKPGKPGGGDDGGNGEVIYSELSHPSNFGQRNYEFYCITDSYNGNCMGSFDTLPGQESTPFLYTPINPSNNDIRYNEAEWFPDGNNLLIKVDKVQDRRESFNFAIVTSSDLVSDTVDTESGNYNLELPGSSEQFRLFLNPMEPDGPKNFQSLGYFRKLVVRNIEGQNYIVAIIEDEDAYTVPDRFNNQHTVDKLFVGFWKVNLNCNLDKLYMCIGQGIDELEDNVRPKIEQLELEQGFEHNFSEGQLRFPNAVFELKHSNWGAQTFDVSTFTDDGGIQRSYVVYEVSDINIFINNTDASMQLIAQEIIINESGELTVSTIQDIWARSWEEKRSADLNFIQLFNGGLIFNAFERKDSMYYCALNNGKPDCGCDPSTLEPCDNVVKILDYENLDRECKPNFWFGITPDGNYILANAGESSCGMLVWEVNLNSPTATQPVFQKFSNYMIHPLFLKFRPNDQ